MSLRESFRYSIAAAVFLLLCLAVFMRLSDRQVDPAPGKVLVHLFEWGWPDVASECESFLGPAGYAAVQVSPAQEHVPGDAWWTRYQPVSYRLESRGGTRAQFKDMVRRCRAAGVSVIADAVINHMSGVGEGVGVAGSVYGRYEYPVPYRHGDFHHCGRYGDDDIRDYHDAWEVRNCELADLADLDTGDPSVQAKIAAYLDDMLAMGVGGFRIDAAKHMEPGEIGAILDRLAGQPAIIQEVIDRGSEPITGGEYTPNGNVSEFRFGMELYRAFSGRDLARLEGLGAAENWIPPDLAVVFVDNHDIQRGHAGAGEVLTHRQWRAYQLANVFMLAWPYGAPMVMSSYRFEDSDQGPPSTPPVDKQGVCSAEWVCEHRDPAIVAMVGFRNHVQGQPMIHWTQLNPVAIAFSRGDRGFVAINAGASPVDARVPVGLKPGRYRNIVEANGEPGELTVNDDQVLALTLQPMSAVAIVSAPGDAR